MSYKVTVIVIAAEIVLLLTNKILVFVLKSANFAQSCLGTLL